MIRSQTTHEQRKELEIFCRQASSKNSEKALIEYYQQMSRSRG